MNSNSRIALAIAATALVVVLFVVLSPGGDDERSGDSVGAENRRETPKPKPETISVDEDGQVVGGVRELEFETGETIEFAVESEIADEVHLHGYDVSKKVPAGHKVDFAVPADIEGKFELELENAVTPIAEVTVNPD